MRVTVLNYCFVLSAARIFTRNTGFSPPYSCLACSPHDTAAMAPLPAELVEQLRVFCTRVRVADFFKVRGGGA